MKRRSASWDLSRPVSTERSVEQSSGSGADVVRSRRGARVRRAAEALRIGGEAGMAAGVVTVGYPQRTTDLSRRQRGRSEEGRRGRGRGAVRVAEFEYDSG